MVMRLKLDTQFDPDSEIIIIYSVTLDARYVKEFTFSDDSAFEYTELLFDPIDLSQDFLELFYSNFIEDYY